jgi:PDZ domain-containing protein
MSQRTLAGLIALGIAAALLIACFTIPLSYVVYRPGVTVNVLGKDGGEPIVQIEGAPSYPDKGQLRMVTVSVTSPETKLRLPSILAAWINRRNAVYPFDSIYTTDETNDDSRAEGAAQMASSQDVATAVALRETGVEVPEVTVIAGTVEGQPADGVLEAGDIVVSVDGTPTTSSDQLVKQIQATPSGETLTFVIKRDGKELTKKVTPVEVDGVQKIGASLSVGYDLPIDVTINIDPTIGGPSAGLIFSLSIYDSLTPGELTGRKPIAGTGEIEPDGSVGPIGGIQQKIAGATRDGAKLFLVPSDNCAEAVGALDATRGNIRLVKVTTMHQARESIETWVADPDASLPTCKAAS